MSSKLEIQKNLAKIPAKVFWSVIAIIVVVSGVISYTNQDTSSNAEKAKAITKELRCLECEGLSINDSETATSKSIAKEVRVRVDRGESKQEILNYFESVYGEFILLEPKAESGNWLLYVVPAFFVIVFGSAVFLVARGKGNKKIQIIFWASAGLLFVIGLVLFVNDANSTQKSVSKSQSKSNEELLQQAVEESPNNGNYRSLAIVQFAQEDFVDALKNFDKAAELDKNDGESRGYAAFIVFQAGQYDLAKQRAEDAVLANPKDVTALFFRGAIYFQVPTASETEKSANLEKANADFDSVLEIAPNSEFAKQIRELRSGS